MERVELRRLVLATGCAEECGGYVFLCDPNWSTAERTLFDSLKLKIQNLEPKISDGWLCVPTGGTSGGIRFARHDEQTLSVAVRGFCEHFRTKRVNALGVLPAYHVSGLMARLRCAATGGSYVDWSWKQLEAGVWPDVKTDSKNWFLSLVPTQLQRLLASATAVGKLRQFRAVFLGGGPLWPRLAEQAALAHIPVATSYGMTETAAMIAAQHPEDFAAGERDCGAVMPHASVDIVDDVTGAGLPVGETGLVRIIGRSLCRGYFPLAGHTGPFITEDLGFFDPRGHLHVVGRRDAVIITGGKKVHPAEVEAALRASGQFTDVAVIGVLDEHWGQIVVACHPAEGELREPEKIEASLAPLSAYKRPKRFVALEVWPCNAQGKLNRAALVAAATSARLYPGEQDRR